MDRTVIVTGAFGALGRAVAARFFAAGDRVAAIDFAGVPADTVGTLCLGERDISDPDTASDVVGIIARQLGAPSVLLNIAGGFAMSTLEQADPSLWERLWRMNVLTAASMTRAALPLLRQSPTGRIVNIGSLSTTRPSAATGAYSAAKSGVHRLTEALAEELAGSGITANAVLPAVIDTPANRAAMPDADPAGFVSTDSIARVIEFLASEDARIVSGALISVR